MATKVKPMVIVDGQERQIPEGYELQGYVSESQFIEALARKMDASAMVSNLTYMATQTPSGIESYMDLVKDTHDPRFPGTVTVYESPNIGANEISIGGFIGDPFMEPLHVDNLAISIIGEARKADADTANVSLRFEVWVRQADNSEYQVSSSGSAPVTIAQFMMLNATALVPHLQLVAGDRLVFKYFASKFGSGTNPKVRYRVGGDNPMRVLVPLPVSGTSGGGSSTGVTLNGDTDIWVNQNKQYTITNYSSFSNYSVSVTAGTVSISGNTISFTAPAVAQSVTLTVTVDGQSSYFTLLVQAAGVQKPTNQTPVNNTSNSTTTLTLTADAFQWTGIADTHLKSDWEVSEYSDFSIIAKSSYNDTVNKTSWEVSGLDLNKTYYWRVRYYGVNNGVSAYGNSFIFDTNVGVNTPTNIDPVIGKVNQSLPVTLTASAFAVTGPGDTHSSSDWQVATDIVFSNIKVNVVGSTSNKTSLVLTKDDLDYDQEYYWRTRQTGNAYGTSEWSTPTKFTTEEEPVGGFIGEADGPGFGVGTYPDTLPAGFSAMTGTDDPSRTHANYGNYQYSDGSILGFIPKYFYRIGHPSSPRYATYGANAIDIVGIETFANRTEANNAGYALHRAFIDGGSEKHGFFIDKYLASPNGNGKCKSIKNGVPISLTTGTTYTSSQTYGGVGQLHDAVLLSRGRGIGFNNATVFMYSALALLSLARAQAVSSNTYCAWYDSNGNTNFPKGCNNNALGDSDDPSISYTSAGDSGNANKPKTGSANNLAKTTHNGQECGIADLNGSMYQVALGITNAGSSGTDSAQIKTTDAYVLKESVALSTLTEGWSSTSNGNEAWGNDVHLATLYDKVTGILPWGGSDTGAVYFGNNSNQVFSEAVSGVGWLRTAAGLQKDSSSMSGTGTNLFGKDYCYKYNIANMYPLCSGGWDTDSAAGLFCRGWNGGRSGSNSRRGFRSALYAN